MPPESWKGVRLQKSRHIARSHSNKITITHDKINRVPFVSILSCFTKYDCSIKLTYFTYLVRQNYIQLKNNY